MICNHIPGRLAAAALAAASLSLLGSMAASAQPAGTPVRGGVAIVAIGDDPPTVNPNISTGIPDQLIGCQIYQGLTVVTTDLKVQPLLARSWTVSADGLTYDFQLVSAKWHDGKPFTSEDVKYSLLEISSRYSAIFASAGRMIEAIDTPAPDKVTIRLKEPFGPFLLSLSCVEGGAIMPAHVYRGTDARQNPATTSKPVGTGPFILAEWKRGDSIRLVRNKDYWEKGKPYLDEVIAKTIPTASSMIQALQAGEVDFIPGYYIAPNDHAVIKRDKRLKLAESGFPSGTALIFMNVQRKPLDDVRVRQALFIATDREYLLKNAWFGAGTVSRAPFNSEIAWAINPDTDYTRMYGFDPNRANQILDDAGYKRGADGIRFKLRIAYAANAGDRAQVAVALKSMWRTVGIDLAIDPIERAAQLKRIHQDRDYDLSIEAYSTYGDPALGITRTFQSSSIGKVFGNLSNYGNPELDALLQKGERSTEQAARAEAYKAAQVIIARDLPVMSVRDARTMDGATAKLNGVWEMLGPALWTDAWLSK